MKRCMSNLATAPIVVKLGGEVIAGPGLHALCIDIAALAHTDALVIVHGGGKLASTVQRALGQTPCIVHGRRVTDDEALEVMKMTVAGVMNVDLCAALTRAGAHPVGLHGASSCVVRAERQAVWASPEGPVDYGHVGEVVGVNTALLTHLMSANYLPVISCLGCDAQGAVYNINADAVANQLALHLQAHTLALISDVPGILRNLHDPSSRIASLTRPQALAAMQDGTISGGMIPKVEESLAALAAGLHQVFVLGRLAPSDLQRALREPGSVGTVITN